MHAHFEIHFFLPNHLKSAKLAAVSCSYSSSACGGKEFQKKTIRADSSRDKTKADSSRDILDPKSLLIVAAQNPEAPFSTVDII